MEVTNTAERFITNYFFYFKTFIQTENNPKTLYDPQVQFSFVKYGNYQYSMKFVGQSKMMEVKINHQLQGFLEQDQETQEYNFYIPESQNQFIVLQSINQQNNKDYEFFRELYCRLAFQQAHGINSETVDEKDFPSQIFIFMNLKYSVQTNQKLEKAFQLLLKKNQFFVQKGKFFKKNLNFDKYESLLEQCIFLLDRQGFQSKMMIYDENEQIENQWPINNSLKFSISINDQILIFRINNDEEVFFVQFQENVVIQLENLMKQLQQESVYKMHYQEIQNSERGKFYLQTNIDQDEIQQNYRNVVQPQKYYDFSFQDKQEEMNLTTNDIIKGFNQFQTSNKILVNKEANQQFVDLNYDQLKQQNPFNIKTTSGNILKPSNIKLLDNEHKFVCQGQDPNTAYLADFEKQKVITEYQPKYQNKIQEINDLTPWDGKQAFQQPRADFMTVGNYQITRFDNRQKEQVTERYYKSFEKTMEFMDKIYSVKENKFLVTSKDGQLRTFGKLDSKVSAKNLIPSFNGDPIVHIDCSSDGNLFLLTFKDYLMIMPTIQDGKSAFEYMFRKDKKPGLIQLEVNKKDLFKFKESKLDFKQAKFDEDKDGIVSRIIATSGKFLFLWRIKDIMNNKRNCSQIQEMDNEIVKSEFVDKQILTAYKNQLKLKKPSDF